MQNSKLGNVLEAVGQEFKESGQVVIEQIGVAQKKQQAPSQKQQQQTQDDKQEFLEGLYGKAGPIPDSEIAEKELEDKKKAEALKQQLHNEYYQNLIHPAKQQEEERPAEKLEKEKKMEELEASEKQAKKPPPLPISARQHQGSAEIGKSMGD